MLDKLYENLPEYYPTMYLDKYTPEQILIARRKSMLKNLQESEDTTEIVITTKEKTKWGTIIRKRKKIKRKNQY